MRFWAEGLLVLFLLSVLLLIGQMLGERTLIFAACFSTVWFLIAMTLLTRPPGIPEFISEEPGSDEQYVTRKDIVPKLSWTERVRFSLAVACGLCVLLLLTLTILG